MALTRYRHSADLDLPSFMEIFKLNVRVLQFVAQNVLETNSTIIEAKIRIAWITLLRCEY